MSRRRIAISILDLGTSDASSGLKSALKVPAVLQKLDQPTLANYAGTTPSAEALTVLSPETRRTLLGVGVTVICCYVAWSFWSKQPKAYWTEVAKRELGFHVRKPLEHADAPWHTNIPPKSHYYRFEQSSVFKEMFEQQIVSESLDGHVGWVLGQDKLELRGFLHKEQGFVPFDRFESKFTRVIWDEGKWRVQREQ